LNVNSGSGVIDSCATKCEGYKGSCVYFESQDVDVVTRGLSLLDCSSEFGALCDWDGVRAVTTKSNLTSMKGGSGMTGTMYQTGSGVSTNGSFVLVVKCGGGYGCFAKYSGSAAMFRQCFFVGSVGAIVHFSYGATSQTRLESCYFVNTKLMGERFYAGSVLVDSCLFAGKVQSTVSFIPTGVQISFASTEVSFDTASLLPFCDRYGRFHTPTVTETRKGTETPEGTGTPAIEEGHKREDVPATRKARIIPFVVLHLVLLALGFTL
jgi:hypothetical protein